ncbi:MAG: glutamate--tRNA ligase family protein [Saprospiraceae bacterium]|nr:glutamate--tRNA ligase family protein [Saprospiraceae bacterium]
MVNPKIPIITPPKTSPKTLLKTRIAPTPSGFLHIGNGASFVATWALARACGGTVLLRIDDLDAERMRLEYVEDIFRTLDWLGLDWDEGAFSVEDFSKNWSQHLRLEAYQKALKELQQTGDLYACTCSRKDIRVASTNGLYPNTCRNKRVLTAENTANYQQTTAWRILVEEEKMVHFKMLKFERERLGNLKNFPNVALNTHLPPLSILTNFDKKNAISDIFSVNLSQQMGDFIVKQKKGLPAYQLASLVDDGLFNINFIVRGQDLLHSTAAQIFLAERLNYTPFLRTTFWHHPLLTDAQGVKLSKSEGSTSLLDFRKWNDSAAIVVKQAAAWLGLVDFEGETALELVDFMKML